MTNPLRFEIVTTRYAAWTPAAGRKYAPVRTSVGVPKFLPVAAHWPRASELVPWGLLDVDDRVEFERRYRDRLVRHGVERIAESLTAIWRQHGERPLALLCFEDVHAGQACHRRVFAAWWLERTGQGVDEIAFGPAQALNAPTLF